MSDESKGGAPKKLSTKDILAAARAEAAQAAGGDAPAASALPSRPQCSWRPLLRQPRPRSPQRRNRQRNQPQARNPLRQPTFSRPRVLKQPGAQPPHSLCGRSSVPLRRRRLQPKPAAGGKPKSTADILAAARAAARGVHQRRPLREAGEKPAAKEKPAKAAVAKAAPAADRRRPEVVGTGDVGGRSSRRCGSCSPKRRRSPQKPAKPSVAPPMPAKPAAVKSATGKPAAASRRPMRGGATCCWPCSWLRSLLIGGLFSSAFAAAWTMLAATTGIATLATARFMLPNVLTEPPSKFKIGSPSDFDLGTVATKFVATNGIWIVHTEGYKGKNLIYALISVCTHLGCTPSWLEGERKFKCPCHGSGFYITGINFEGPAPRPLERAGIRLAEDGCSKSTRASSSRRKWVNGTTRPRSLKLCVNVGRI